MKGNLVVVLIMVSVWSLILVPVSVYGSFHFWDINEIYSNADGTQQFIELTTTSNGQQFLTGHTITATSDGVLKTYLWTMDSSSPTINTKILLATTSMAAVTNFPTPDFIISDNFFDPTAATITFNFGENSDIVVINGGLPQDGLTSIDDQGTEQTASPTNYAGETATPPFGMAFADFVFSIPPEIGPSSSDDGKFDLPEDVTVDSDGNIYVSDAGNFRIQKFNPTGNFQLKFGSMGLGPSQFNNPFGIAVNSFKEIYVVDSGNNRIQKFNSEGGFLSEFGTFGFNDSEFFIPFGIGIDSSDNTYVLDSGNGRIQKFNSADVFQGWLGGCTSGANCDVINQHSNGFLCTASTCSVSAGFGEGQFTLPQGIDFDSSDNIYVTEITNNRVQKFDSGGNFILMFGWGVDSGANEFEICSDTCQLGMPGSGDGQFNVPTDIAIDSFDNVHVVDNVNDRIQKFNSEGVFLSKFGLSSSAEGDFNGPQGITIDSIDNMFVVDRGNNRIQKFGDDSCSIPISGVWIVTEDCEIFTDETTPDSVIIQNSSVVTVNSEGSLTVPSGKNLIIVGGSGLHLIQDSTFTVLS